MRRGTRSGPMGEHNLTYGMWRRVGFLKTDVSEESVSSIFKVEKLTQARKSVRRLLTDWHYSSEALKALIRTLGGEAGVDCGQ
jgi:hypothetical protein